MQKQLNEIYGDEYDKVNLVTDAYRDQTDVLEENAKKKAENYLNENPDKIEEAKNKMTAEYEYELGNFNYGIFEVQAEYGINLHNQIEQLAKDNGIEWDKNKGFVFKGTAEEAREAINSFMSDVRALKNEQTNLVADSIVSQSDLDALEDNYTSFFSEMSKQLGYADSIIDGYKETFETAQLAEIATDKDLSNGHNEATNAVEAYNEAILKSEDPYNNDNVKQAWDNLQMVKQGIQENEDEWGQYSNIMDNVFAEANDNVYSYYQKMQNDDSISKLASDLKGLSDKDLQSMADDDVEDAFDKLCEVASEYGLEIQDVIDLLVELGYVQGEVQGSTSDDKTDISFDLENFSSNISEITSAYSTLSFLVAN